MLLKRFDRIQVKRVFLLLLMLSMVLSVSGIANAWKLARPQNASTPSMDILINEVAWGGTQANQDHTWIELYNNTDDLQNISGYILKIGSNTFTLDGNINPRSYFLIESVEAATSATADQILPLSFSSKGEKITLSNSKGLVVDTANANGGKWPAGQNSGKFCSMERIHGYGSEADNSWKTSTATSTITDEQRNAICGTPKSANSVADVTATPIPPTKTATPTGTPAPSVNKSVIINEVGWSGTNGNRADFPEDQWIELFNPTNETVNLSGWTIISVDTTNKDKGYIRIELTGSLDAGQYYLLERLSDNVVTNIKADLVYQQSGRVTNLLSTIGESLQLRDDKNNIKDTANSKGIGWIAGSKNPVPCSMERYPNVFDGIYSWVTSGEVNQVNLSQDNSPICGSPKDKNWSYNHPATPTPTVTPTPSPTPTSNLPTSVVINELMVQPRTDFNGDGMVNGDDSYIELANLSNNRISLKGWRLDDQEGDSPAYIIGDVSIEPNGYLVFYTSTTGIVFSTGSDSVRLYKNNLALVDAYTYNFNPAKNISWCRYENGWGSWQFGCEPTPLKANLLRKGYSVEAILTPIPTCAASGMTGSIAVVACDEPPLVQVYPYFESWDDLYPIKISIFNTEFWIE